MFFVVERGGVMPVKASKRGGRLQVVESASGKAARGAGGGPVKKGGHSSKAAAQAQARAINASLHKRGKI